MTPYSANPFVYIFSIVAILAVVGYYGYIALDRFGLQTEQGTAEVRAKRHYARGETSVVNIVAGRPWVQSQETPETFVVNFKFNNGEIAAAVTPTVFAAIQSGDTVRIAYQRRRLSGKLEVVDVTP